MMSSNRPGTVAFAVGMYIGAAYFFTSSTSFANPAVTVARTLSDTFAGIAPSSVPAFIVCQLAGGLLLGLPVVRTLYPNVREDAEVGLAVPSSSHPGRV